MPGRKNHAFVQYFDAAAPIEKVDNALICFCFRWATDRKMDYVSTFNVMSEENFKIEEWYGLIPLSSVVSVFHIVWSNCAVKDLAPQVARSTHPFYVSRFYQARKLTGKRAQKWAHRMCAFQEESKKYCLLHIRY